MWRVMIFLTNVPIKKTKIWSQYIFFRVEKIYPNFSQLMPSSNIELVIYVFMIIASFDSFLLIDRVIQF